MTWQYTPQIIPLFITILLLAWMAIFAWKQRATPGVTAFIWLIAFVIQWIFGYILELSAVSLESKIFWAKFQYFGILATPALWLIFMLRYTKRDRLLNIRTMALLAAAPLIILALVWTNESHHLIWASTRLDSTGVFRRIIFGPGFWFVLAYLNITTLLALAALLNSQTRSPGVYRKQAIALLVATLAPLVASMVSVSNLNPFAPLDLTPSAFIISGLAWYYGRTRLRLFDVLPVARATLIEKLVEGVIVIDTQNRVVDLNPAAQKITALTSAEAIGQPLARAFSPAESLLEGSDPTQERHEELAWHVNGARRTFRAHLVPMFDENGRFYGRIITLYDITSQQNNQEALQQTTDRLRLVQDVDRAILTRKKPAQIADQALEYLHQFIPAITRGSILTFDHEAGIATILAVHSGGETKLPPNQTIPLQQFTILKDLHRNKYILNEDLAAAPDLGIIDRKLLAEGVHTTLIMPLTSQNHLIGSMNIGAGKAGGFSEQDIVLTREVANLLAIAIFQSRLSEQSRQQTEILHRRERYLSRLHEIANTVVREQDSQTMLQALANSLLGFEDADNCFITFWDEELRQANITAVSGNYQPSFNHIKVKEGQVMLVESALNAGKPIVVPKLDDSPHVSPDIAAMFPSYAALALPLAVGEQKIGAAIITYDQAHEFSEDEVRYGEQAAAQISLALVKAQLLETEREQRQLAEILRDIGITLSATLDVNLLLDQVLDEMPKLVPFDKAAVLLVENGRARITRRRGYDSLSSAILDEIDTLNLDLENTPNLQTMVQTGRPFIISDVETYDGWVDTDNNAPMRAWVGAPIMVDGEPAAFLSVDKNEPGFYRSKHADRLMALASQVSLAFRNARLYQAARRQLDELTALHAVAAAGTEIGDEDLLIERVTAIIGETFFPENFGVLWVDEGSGLIHHHPSYRYINEQRVEHPIPSSEGIVGRVVRTGRPVRVTDVLADPDYLRSDPNTRSEICVPIKVGEKVIGLINAESPKEAAFNEADEQLLLTLARQLATAVENIRLLATERARREEEERLRGAISNLTTVLDLEVVLDSVLKQAKRVVAYDSASLFLLKGDSLVLAAVNGMPSGQDLIGASYPASDQIFLEMSRSKRPLILADAQADSRFNNWGESTHVRGWLGIPLISHNQILGQITFDSRQLNAYNKADVQMAQAFANQAAIAIDNARLYEAEQQARVLADTLRSANQALSQSLDLEKIADRVLDNLEQLIPFDSAALMIIRENQQVSLQATRGFARWTNEEAVNQMVFNLQANRSLNEIAASRSTLRIMDVDRFKGWEKRPELDYIRSWMGVPLIAGGKLIGFFSLDKRETNFFQEEHQFLAEALASQTAVAIQNAQFFQETRRHAEDLTLASEVLVSLNATPDVSQVFPKVAEALKNITACDRATLTKIDIQNREGRMIALDQPRQTIGLGVPLHMQDSAASGDILSGIVHITDNLASEISYSDAMMLYQSGYRSRINLPLLVGNEVSGSLNLAWKKENAFNTAQIPLLRQIASALALALERSRLFTEINRQAHQLTILNQLGRQVTSLLDSQGLFTTVIRSLRKSLDYPRLSIFLVDSTGQEVVLKGMVGRDDKVRRDGPDLYRQPVGAGLIGQVAATGEKLVVNNTRSHADFLPSHHFRIQSQLILPLKIGKVTIGVLNVDSDVPDAFDESDVALMEVVADQLSVALEKVRLFEETRQRAGELEALSGISAALRTAETAPEIVSVILNRLRFEEPAVKVIFLRDPETGNLVAQGTDSEIPALDGSYHLPGEGITGRVAETGEVYRWQQGDNHDFSPLPSEKEALAVVHSNIALPLRAQDVIVGVLHVGLTAQKSFSEGEEKLLTAVAEIAGNALYRAQVMDTLEQRVEARTQELADANLRLQELDKLKSRFVSDVSHELRTPITNIRLYLDLLAHSEPGKLSQYLNVLSIQADRLVNLLEDILNLSRLDASTHPIEMAPVDFNQLVEQIVAAQKPQLAGKPVQMITDLAATLPPVWGEKKQLNQVVTNLIVNAINYTKAGQISVSTNAGEDGRSIRLLVADTGMGIEPEDEPFLFDRFFRGKYAGQSTIPGTGLGLAIVKEIVDLHDGTISLKSSPGQGTTFEIKLPAMSHADVNLSLEIGRSEKNE